MSGTPKRGIDFAGWDSHIFDGDKKIDKLLDAQGWDGFAVYFYLCQRAYATDGYFYRWSYDDAATTARRMAGGIRSETVKGAVGTCSRVGLFDKRLLDAEGILTSRGIQRRFVAAIQKRSYRTVDKRYWLLSEAETTAGKISFLKNFCPDVGESYAVNPHVLPEDGHVLPEDSPKSKVKKSNTTHTAAAGAGAEMLSLSFGMGHYYTALEQYLINVNITRRLLDSDDARILVPVLSLMKSNFPAQASQHRKRLTELEAHSAVAVRAWAKKLV